MYFISSHMSIRNNLLLYSCTSWIRIATNSKDRKVQKKKKKKERASRNSSCPHTNSLHAKDPAIQIKQSHCCAYWFPILHHDPAVVIVAAAAAAEQHTSRQQSKRSWQQSSKHQSSEQLPRSHRFCTVDDVGAGLDSGTEAGTGLNMDEIRSIEC
ncbi:hypothetical protein BC939DRAFT_224952 [Gamsiella multidivaricata]|uniref:uncharacterized protein n=1 Tax=Gamsiella multidivaricata TaxID=101098 RepID=UPI00221F4B6C|nr:uncharacterized protein BC939DRAFT_224952 [Gamsiella multidivaricata]KAI7831283.1 hypothetical protein BC939DRAFT_224952 [Gamsiella multidivaricata]